MDELENVVASLQFLIDRTKDGKMFVDDNWNIALKFEKESGNLLEFRESNMTWERCLMGINTLLQSKLEMLDEDGWKYDWIIRFGK